MAGKVPYVGVVVYESLSNAPESTPLYQEDIVLVYAESDPNAVQLVTDLARQQECTYRNETGESISLSVKSIVDVSAALTEDVPAGGALYTRYFRDFDAYQRLEPLLGDTEPPSATSG
ncbi:DUF4288 domain-containing protein [Nocardia sp. BMG51109]|uniref:DUF4288 domain-containing protein n=1 Tax=Nocardia sp. BMG51109 TaxID=1056816 RepID=UPI000464CEB5|nr:DUF4288 domain-containing protein [Nocardia sp. BMG51109]